MTFTRPVMSELNLEISHFNPRKLQNDEETCALTSHRNSSQFHELLTTLADAAVTMLQLLSKSETSVYSQCDFNTMNAMSQVLKDIKGIVVEKDYFTSEQSFVLMLLIKQAGDTSYSIKNIIRKYVQSGKTMH